jgi:PAS domain S-box-containing protein
MEAKTEDHTVKLRNLNEQLQLEPEEHERSEEILQEIEDRYQDLLEHTKALIYTHDLQGQLLSVNQGAAGLLGYDKNSFLKMNIRDILVPEVRDEFEAYLTEIKRHGVAKGVMFIQTAMGEKRVLEYNNTLHTEGVTSPIVRGIAYDITEHKRAKKTLRQLSEQLSIILESLPIVCHISRTEGDFGATYITQNTKTVTGFDSIDFISNSSFWADRIHPEDAPRIFANLPQLFQKEHHEHQYRWQVADGSYKWFYDYLRLIKSPDGKSYIVGMMQDITDRKRAEGEIQRSYDTQTVINSLLRLSLENIPLEETLRQSLDHILSIPWLSFESRGSIFMVEDEPNFLIMKAQKGLAEPIQKACAKVSLGRCLCGRAALEQKIQFSNCLDESHEISYEGIFPHGHYCVPIIFANKTLGIINIYIKEGHQRDQREEEFLTTVAHTVAGIIIRKRGEEALLRAAQQWRTTFDSITDMVSLLDLEGRILRCNMAMKNFVGKPFNEILNRSCWEIMLGATTPIEDCPFLRAKETLQRETTTLSVNDRWFNVSIDPILDEAGRLIGAVNIMSDITEQKQTEEALRSSEEKYRTILENIEDGYYEVDIAGSFTFYNDSLCRIFGYSREELMGMNDRQYTDQENAKKLFQAFNKVYRTGESSKEFDWEIIRKDRTKRYVEASVSLIKDSSDNRIGFRGIVRDITDRKQTEKEIAALQEQLRQSQKMEAIGHLTGGIAHDFNNLLTVIRGYSDLVLSNLDKNNPLYSDTLEIKNASEKAESLTRQLLAFSRRQVLQPKVLNLNTLVSNMDKMLRRLIGENIELVTLSAKDLGIVKADPGQIEQVIINLAVNARDAMPKGGKLTIETANIELDENYARAHIGVTPGYYVMLSVSDTGIGMSPEIREHIFEPFFTTKENGKGTGLGLSTVYGIVKQSGGNIWVYSEPGRGTTFKIYLSRIEESVELIGPVDAPQKSLEGSETILLVEDEEVVRTLACTILQKNGYTVLEAANGEEALRVVQEQNDNPIHLMLTDVVMPGMSGPEMTKHMSPLHPETKVIYMSGYMDNAIIPHDILKPGLPYLQKPFTPDGLVRKVREVLDEHS